MHWASLRTVVVVDMPLLFETRSDGLMHEAICITAPAVSASEFEPHICV